MCIRDSNNSHKLCGGAKASLVSFAPEDVDVDWIISETDEYWIWTDRNPLQATVGR